METKEDKFFHPSVTADIVTVRYNAEIGKYELLLVKRSDSASAFPGTWALPGGFMDRSDECIADAAARELREETGVASPQFKFVGTFTQKGRDPRGPVHSTAFLAHAGPAETVKAGDDASAAEWFRLTFDPWENDAGERIPGRVMIAIERPADRVHIVLWCERRRDKYGLTRYSVSADGLREWDKLAFDHAEIIATALLADGTFTKWA